jgi:hypothetical protein
MRSPLYIPVIPAHSVPKAAVRVFAYGAGRTDLDGPHSALAARHAT